jgi:phage/conjugal plasmid C-4 type zinc finger TraR family protein
MDEIDLAQQIAEVYENALMKQRIRKATALPEFRHTCEDCGCVIPARRRQANPGATRCTKCQIQFERGGH